MHIVNIVHYTGLLNKNTGLYPVVLGNNFDFNIQFQQNSEIFFIKFHKKQTGIQKFSTTRKNPTKLPKIHTFLYRNSEFHTIHDLENGKWNSILFQVFHTEYKPCNNVFSTSAYYLRPTVQQHSATTRIMQPVALCMSLRNAAV